MPGSPAEWLKEFQVNTGTVATGDQTFTFLADVAFSGTAGELRFIQSGGRTYVQSNTDGDATSDFMTRLECLTILDAEDFRLQLKFGKFRDTQPL